jgi:hypothetical protein
MFSSTFYCQPNIQSNVFLVVLRILVSPSRIEKHKNPQKNRKKKRMQESIALDMKN